MAQQYPRSPWYDQSLPAAASAPGRKKRTGWKITGIALSVLVLIAASVYAFTDTRDYDNWDDFVRPPAEDNMPDEDGYFDDFRDFFSEYYAPVSTSAPDSQLARDTAETDFRLTLHPAEGLTPMSLQELYAACADSVVGIRASGTNLRSGYYWGSGFIVSEDGYVITNQHIISGTRQASVVLTDGREFPALLVGEDAQTDIAVLKIDAEGLPAVELGDSDVLSVGDEVAAIGNPLGSTLSGTLTNGIVSAIDRSISYNGNSLTLLQTNTALNEGNSGGPLFNMYGQVVGITNMKMSAAVSEVTIEGIGFAIPTTTVKTVADRLIADGKYSRPGLGIVVGAVPEEAASHYALPDGLYISSVKEGSSALKEGVQVGDILTHVNGIPVRETEDVLSIRDTLSVGDEMTLTLFREGKTFTVTIVLQELSELY